MTFYLALLLAFVCVITLARMRRPINANRRRGIFTRKRQRPSNPRRLDLIPD